MKTSVLAIALTMLGAVVATPSAVAEEKASCTWTASQVVAPEGYDSKKVRVVTTDSRGNYAGTVSPPNPEPMDGDVVIWTGGRPRVADELGDISYPTVRDENSSGTVLLSARFNAEGRNKTVLLSNAHSGRGTVTEVVAPAGYTDVSGIALNERGDVLARARSIKEGQQVAFLFLANKPEPVVVETWSMAAVDLDDDGTVLITPFSGGYGYLWRDGQHTFLTVPEGTRPSLTGLRSGKVIGYDSTNWPDALGLLWDGPDSVSKLEKTAIISKINAHGTIAGLRAPEKPGVWQGTKYLGDLPFPVGVTGMRSMDALGDDGSIFGLANAGEGSVHWTSTCAGKPAGR